MVQEFLRSRGKNVLDTMGCEGHWKSGTDCDGLLCSAAKQDHNVSLSLPRLQAHTITATHGWPQAYQLFTGTVNLPLVLVFFNFFYNWPAVLSLSMKEGKHACHCNDNSEMITLNDDGPYCSFSSHGKYQSFTPEGVAFFLSFGFLPSFCRI